MIHFVVMSAGWFKHSYRYFSQISIEVMIWYCSHFWMFFYMRNTRSPSKFLVSRKIDTDSELNACSLAHSYVQ